jgi:hypothetical protein
MVSAIAPPQRAFMPDSIRGRWVALGVLVGCAADPAAPSAHEQFDPPPVYREWFASTEACSGLGGDFDRLRFYRVPGDEFSCPSGTCVARWIDAHQIFVAEAFLENEMVLRHEMLHDLIGQSGHPDPPFGESGCRLTWTSWSGRTAGVPRID